MMKSNSIGSALRGVVNDLHTPRIAYDYGLPRLTWALTTGPRHTVVISAKTGVGKTAFALQVALSMARSGRNVAYLSLEMAADQLAERLLARAGTMAAIRHRDATAKQEAAMRTEMDKLKSLPIDLVEAPGITVADVASYIKQHPTVDVIIIDYVQLMGGQAANAYEMQTNISKALATLAKDSAKCIIVLAQENLKGDHDDDAMGNIQGTAQYEQDADAIISLCLEKKGDYKSRRVLKVKKNRHGDPGMRLYLDYDGNMMMFTESEDQAPRTTSTMPKFDFKKSGGETKTVCPNPAYPKETIEVPADTPEYVWRNMRVPQS